MCNKYIVIWSGQECSSHVNPYLCALFYWSELMMKEEYFNILMNLVKKAQNKDEVPVGAIIVRNDKVIAKAYNKKNKSKNIFDHAEIIAIKKASKKKKDWRLNDCDLYVTLKPCNMCSAAINQSQFRNVYYLLDKDVNKKEYYKTKYIKTNNSMQSDSYSAILKGFFEKKRDK